MEMESWVIILFQMQLLCTCLPYSNKPAESDPESFTLKSSTGDIPEGFECSFDSKHATFRELESTDSPVPDKENLLPTRFRCCPYIQYIYGGKHIYHGEFPSLALLHYMDSNQHSSFSCGGTIISNHYVLTAAHCVVGAILEKSGKLWKVRLGETDFSQTVCVNGTCDNGVEEKDIEKIIVHDGYSEKHKMHDIALIRFSPPIDYHEINISPACLSWTPGGHDLQFHRDNLFTAVGWGRTLEAKQSKIGNKIQIPLYDHEECRAKYLRMKRNITHAQICAGGEFKKDSCDGDSGGPLFTIVDNCNYLEGIVSFGRGCGLENWPGVYTNVTAYRDWIMENLEA